MKEALQSYYAQGRQEIERLDGLASPEDWVVIKIPSTVLLGYLNLRRLCQILRHSLPALS